MTEINSSHEKVISRKSDMETEVYPDTATEQEVHHYYHADDDFAYPTTRKLDRIIWLIAVVLEILIGFRVFLKLIAANPQSGFASFIYSVTAPFLAPFAGLTPTPAAEGAVLEISSIIAMAVYALLFWLAIYVTHLIRDR